MSVKVLVISGEGINCERETASAFSRLGAESTIVHVREWLDNPELVLDFQILAIPGGFSFGDELHSGQILAIDLKYRVASVLQQFIDKRGLVIGICNGFQVLMKLGVFEHSISKIEDQRSVTLFHNDSFKFIDQWVLCHAVKSKCIWTQGVSDIYLPMRHGEGRIILDESQVDFFKEERVVFVYDKDVNGSYKQIAGITDQTGQILGLMPHPEAALESWLNPPDIKQDPANVLKIFNNAITYSTNNL